MSVKESGEARTWRDVVVRKRSLRAVVRNCMVAVAFDEEAIVLGWSSQMRWRLRSELVLRGLQ
jgi:hypothetical protein